MLHLTEFSPPVEEVSATVFPELETNSLSVHPDEDSLDSCDPSGVYGISFSPAKLVARDQKGIRGA